MTIKNRGVPQRIDIELDKIIKEIQRKNEMNFRQASYALAKAYDQLKGKTISIKEVKF